VRPLPRYSLAVMAAFVVFVLWVPLLALALRAVFGARLPPGIGLVAPLLTLAPPTVAGLALSDYLADRPGLVRPYQPKPRTPGEQPPGG
jgi:hypothetical protein